MAWDWLRQGGPVSDAVGGGIDFFTGGFTDFDGRGKGDSNLFNPIGGGSDKKWGESSSSDAFNLDDAIQAFTKGYGSRMGPGASTPGGSSFLNAYTSGKSSTPTTTSPVSNSNVFTAGGGTHSIGDSILIKEQPDWYAVKDKPEDPVGAYMGPGGSTAKGPSTGDKIKSGIVDLGKAFLTKTILGLCDIRTKTDISPLEMTEVNDDLAQVAFFVKELRECS